MKRENRRHPRAAPQRSCQAIQQQEEQDGVGQMQQQVGQVMALGLQMIELEIDDVGYPRQRMPIGGVAGGEGPFEALPVQALLDVRVQHDVIAIVIVDKGAGNYLVSRPKTKPCVISRQHLGEATHAKPKCNRLQD